MDNQMDNQIILNIFGVTGFYSGLYLVSESMQGSSQAIHSCTEGKIRVRQGTTHQVTGVGTDITTFVVTESEEKYTKTQFPLLYGYSNLLVITNDRLIF